MLIDSKAQVMTSIVAIRCTDGVVIGADSAVTHGDGAGYRTMETPTEQKIEIIENKIIIAGTGAVGHHQRFVNRIKQCWRDKRFDGADAHGFAKVLSSEGIKEFAETHVQNLAYSALVAYEAKGEPILCEFLGGPILNPNTPTSFQPEMKDVSGDLWFASTGSGQQLTDPFLAFIRNVFWSDGPPNLKGGKFTVRWTLQHVCELAPGGINEPIHIATLSSHKGKFKAKMLTEEDMLESANLVSDATAQFSKFRDVILGTEESTNTAPPPKR